MMTPGRPCSRAQSALILVFLLSFIVAGNRHTHALAPPPPDPIDVDAPFRAPSVSVSCPACSLKHYPVLSGDHRPGVGRMDTDVERLVVCDPSLPEISHAGDRLPRAPPIGF